MYTTCESIRQGEEIMAQARIDAASNLAEQIKRGEYISSIQLQTAWQVKPAAISSAVAAERLFAVVGPSGENYYPAFFTDPSLDRCVLERVTKALGSLPATSKYHFFTSAFTWLGECPLDAPRKGRVEQTLAAAAGYAER